MGNQNLRESLRPGLLDSYRPRVAGDTPCAKCSKKGKLLSFHVSEYSGSGKVNPPPGCVPMSSRKFGNTEGWNGSFPLCTNCAPICTKCGLPMPTEAVLEYIHNLTLEEFGVGVRQGQGFCEHMKLGSFASALAKRAFKLGRFGKKTKPPKRD